MKRKMRLAIGPLVAIALVVVTLPASGQQQFGQHGDRVQFKQGKEVGKRSRELQKINRDVRNAFETFERNAKRRGHGHVPKHDESFLFTQKPAGGTAALKSAKSPASPFRKVGFGPQGPTDYSAYGVEMIFIPSYVDPYVEWQGTIAITKYDPSGAYIGQYVADVAMVPDATQAWEVVFEVSYQDGEAYLQYGNPDFEPGLPASEQPGLLLPPISALRTPSFMKASFGPEPQRFGGPHFGTPSTPKIRWVMKCTTIQTVAWSGVGCGLVALMSLGVGYAPCAVGAAGASFTACTLTAIFG